MARKNNYILVLGGLFIALEVVLGKWLALDLVFVRISFVFVPVALGGIVFGPLWNGLLYAAADIAGVLIFPSGMAFHPGFTLCAFLSGFAYGFFLNAASPARSMLPTLFRGSPISVPMIVARTALAAFCVTVPVNTLLNSYWVSTLMGKAYTYYLGTRLIKELILFPVQVAVVGLLWRYLGRHITRIWKLETRS